MLPIVESVRKEAPASGGERCWDLQLVMSVNRQFLTYTVQVEMTNHPRFIHQGGITDARLLGPFQAHEIPRTLPKPIWLVFFPDQKIWDISEHPGFGSHGKKINTQHLKKNVA